MKVGVSILTNGSRRKRLEKCVWSFLENCHYRPLKIAIFTNGSTDDTEDWILGLPETYGVEWVRGCSEVDLGCARGTNESIGMVSDCEYQIHLESDFEHLSPEESGVDRMWLHRALEIMDSGRCDYLYLRRMRDSAEARMHWWSQWMPRVSGEDNGYLMCPGFWWSNNPTLFRTSSLKNSGTLPLDESMDGPKGTPGWSQPELQTPRPMKAWIHRWGMFVHERGEGERFDKAGCGRYGRFGMSGCKYGFWYEGEGHPFCLACDHRKGFEDMPAHEERAKKGEVMIGRARKTVAFHSNQLAYRGTEVGSWNYAYYNEELLGNRSVFLAPRSGDNVALERFTKRFETYLYDDWDEAENWLGDNGVDVLHMRKEGLDDGFVSKNCRTVVHCAFPRWEPHGDVYCHISEWAARKAGGSLFIPHIVERLPNGGDLRFVLGIPKEAKVFGWIGGRDSFNLRAGKDAIKALHQDGRTYFLFVGVEKFIDSKQVVFLPPTHSPDDKGRFVETCDAMLHSRWEGDTFGLAVAEFSAAGRPVVVWNGGVGQAHLELLGDKAIKYDGSHDLIPILQNWNHKCGREWDVYTERFSPENVMRIFKEVCGL